MLKLTFTSAKGKSVELTSHAPFLLSSYDGIGDVDAEIQSERSPYQDGSIYIDSLLQDRPINLEFAILGDDSKDLTKQKRIAGEVFNPKLGIGLLRYEKNDTLKEINVYVEKVPSFPSGTDNRGETYQKTVVNLIANDPYWRDPNHVSTALQSYVGNFELPMTFPFELGMAGDYAYLYNDGDEPAPIMIDIQGPTSNPRIINRTTGEYIKINRSISDDEIVHIDTTPNQKRVELYTGNGLLLNIFGNLDHNSDLFSLQVGENEIEHIADSGNEMSGVAIAWSNRYVVI